LGMILNWTVELRLLNCRLWCILQMFRLRRLTFSNQKGHLQYLKFLNRQSFG
jgi:hypothetical protein